MATGPGGAFGKATVEDPGQRPCGVETCPHTQRQHRSRRFVSRCHFCPDRHHYVSPEERARQLRQAALRADRNHRCTDRREIPPATALGRAVGLRLLECIDCGRAGPA
jgi:hypothetical protein